jgi:hypothetical protein
LTTSFCIDQCDYNNDAIAFEHPQEDNLRRLSINDTNKSTIAPLSSFIQQRRVEGDSQ